MDRETPFDPCRQGLGSDARGLENERLEESRDKLRAEIVPVDGPAGPAGPVKFSMPTPPSPLAGTAAGRTGIPVPPRPPPVPSATPMATAVDGDLAETGLGEVRIRTAVYRKKNPFPGIVMALLVLAVAAAALAYATAVVKKGGAAAKPMAPFSKALATETVPKSGPKSESDPRSTPRPASPPRPRPRSGGADAGELLPLRDDPPVAAAQADK